TLFFISPLKTRLSSLTIGDSERKASAGPQREPMTDIPAESPGLVQRCVVVQKDQLGFGFTVCGERVKLVQNVRPGGAAVKAGVQEGDRIIKVNGSLVSSMSHQEVVKLIKCKWGELFTNNIHTVYDFFFTTGIFLTFIIVIFLFHIFSCKCAFQDPEVQKHATEILRKMLEQEEAELQDLLEEQLRNPSPSLGERIESAKRRAHQVRVKIQQDQMDGPFQDIELLKSRPAHMTVFMRYVFTQLLDPNPLLFYLSVEAYLGSSPKDARALAPQICSHFLDPDAVLMTLKTCILSSFHSESRLHAQEDIRGPLSELQQQVLPDIQDQIQDYRNKQMMGLGSLFGEGDLQHLDGDPAKERQVVDRQVTALWEILGAKKEKDGEDKKRNPILKYIGKPRTTSQSIKKKRNFINSTASGTCGFPRANALVLFYSVFVHLMFYSPTISVRLGRSESLKAHGEGRRRGAASGAESVPRSRSDVDMEDCGEEREGPGLRPLQHSTSSSASSSSARSLENPTPPYTPRSRRGQFCDSPTVCLCRSMDSPLALLPDAVGLEEEVCDGQNWQETVPPQLLATLSPKEVDRQAVIYELFTTEVSHLRTLRVLDQVFFQKMRSVLNSDELACIFPNLPQVYELHASLCEAMKKRRDTPIVQNIGDVMLSRFEGAAGDEFQEQASQLCSQQSQALELIKNKQRKDPRFAHIIQECEASPHCRRLQLKDLLVSEMQRLTKYPLLLDNIIKYTDAGSSDLPSLQRAQTCCRGILQVVNEVVGEMEQRQRLSQYQRRLDAAPQFKSLDLTTKRMIHEGPLTWKVSKDKQIEIQALLLSDCLVLLQRGPDDRLQLRYPSRWLSGGGGGSGDSKTSFSPLVKLDSLLVRSVATGRTVQYMTKATFRQQGLMHSLDFFGEIRFFFLCVLIHITH
uniref:Rho guanine nucleotide exchange factor (GEF) 11 n=1 Tax=Sphaeramia orbicularis TaxID=375764 RepID=A0A673CEC2_9TELE